MGQLASSPARRLTELLAVIALAASLAGAQPLTTTEISPTTVQSPSISAAGQSQIDEFVDAYAGALTGADSSAQLRARDAILRPLSYANISIAFRQAFDRALEPHLQTLVAAGDSDSVLVALRIAGELATGTSTDLILPYLESEDLGLRFFAISRFERSFDVVAARTPSLSTSKAERIVRRLAATISEEPDERIADAAIRALQSAAAIEQPNFEGARFGAVTGMAEGVSARLAAAGVKPTEGEVLVALRACGAVRDALSDANATPTDEACIAGIGLGGDIIARVFDAQRKGTLPEVGRRSLQVQAVASGEAALHWGLQRYADNHNESSPEPTSLSRMLEQGDERAFRDEVVRLLGPSSEIVEKFGFEADRFIF